jgi:hypothetical protein
MTNWIEHTTDTCPVDPETVVAVRFRDATERSDLLAVQWNWSRATNAKAGYITHYRIITPAKPPEPEMTKPEPDLITLRLECLKLANDLAAQKAARVSHTDDLKELANILLHYVLNGSVDKA